MIITVSGPAGVGKSTVAKKLANRLGLNEINAGKIFRDMADERDMELNEFQKLAEDDPEIDKLVDQKQKEIAKKEDDVVLDAWLAGWMAGDNADLKVWLYASEDIRLTRICKREDKSFEKVKKETIERERSNKRRYLDYYNIDLDDKSIYDLIINTEKWNVQGVVNILLEAIDNMDITKNEE